MKGAREVQKMLGGRKEEKRKKAFGSGRREFLTTGDTSSMKCPAEGVGRTG